MSSDGTTRCCHDPGSCESCIASVLADPHLQAVLPSVVPLLLRPALLQPAVPLVTTLQTPVAMSPRVQHFFASASSTSGSRAVRPSDRPAVPLVWSSRSPTSASRPAVRPAVRLVWPWSAPASSSRASSASPRLPPRQPPLPSRPQGTGRTWLAGHNREGGTMTMTCCPTDGRADMT